MNDLFEQLNQFIINTTGGQAAAEARQKEAAKQMAKIKDAEGVNVKKNVDGTLAPTIGDSINNFISKIGGSAPSMTDVQREYNTIGVQRKSSQLIDKNPTIDYTGIDRSDFDAVQSHTDFQNQLKLKQSEGYDTTGVTDRASLKAAVDLQDLDADNKKTKGSVTYKDSRSDRTEDLERAASIRAENLALDAARQKRVELVSDRNFALQNQQSINQNNQAQATLAATLAQAKMSDVQQTLDREYLDRRDLRDYEYRIKQDDQDRMDDIFKLLLGAGTNLF